MAEMTPSSTNASNSPSFFETIVDTMVTEVRSGIQKEMLVETTEIWERAMKDLYSEAHFSTGVSFPEEAVGDAKALFEEAQKVNGRLDEKTSQIAKLLSIVYFRTGHTEEAFQLFKKQKELFIESGDNEGAFPWAFGLGKMCEELNDFNLAIQHYESGFGILKTWKSHQAATYLRMSESWQRFAYFDPKWGRKLSKLYVQQGRDYEGVTLASECFVVARDNFQHIPLFYRRQPDYILYKLWAKILGEVYLATNQEYMARHLWNNMIDELVLVDWECQKGEIDLGPVSLIEHEKSLWRQKLDELGPDSDDDNADGINV